MSKRVREILEGVVGSPSPGRPALGANLGTGAVVKKDVATVAKDWSTALGREASLRERPAWEKHAEREGLSPDEIEQGWASLSKAATRDESNALATLRKVFGETVSWTGAWVPNKNMLEPDETGVVRRKKLEKAKTEATGFVGFPKMHQAPQVGNAKGQAQIANETPPGFPFATRAAELVWSAVQQLARTHKIEEDGELLRMAVEASEVSMSELTPEDMQMLRMAVQQLRNGTPQTNVRTSGVPGRRGIV